MNTNCCLKAKMLYVSLLMVGFVFLSIHSNAQSINVHNVGVTQQVVFNNAKLDLANLVFAVSHDFGATQDVFEVRISPTHDFSGAIYTQQFLGTFLASTTYELDCDNLSPAFTPVDGETYYLSVRSSANGGGSWSPFSTFFHSFTHDTHCSPTWYQTTKPQFDQLDLDNLQTHFAVDDYIDVAAGVGVEIGNANGNYASPNSKGFGPGEMAIMEIDVPTVTTMTHAKVFFKALATNVDRMYWQGVYELVGTEIHLLEHTGDVYAGAGGIAGGGRWVTHPLENPVTLDPSKTYYLAYRSRSSGNTIGYNGTIPHRFGTAIAPWNAKPPVVDLSSELPGTSTWALNMTLESQIFTGTSTVPSSGSSSVDINAFREAIGWNEVSWEADVNGGDVRIQLFYDNGGTLTLIPDADLPGNSAGFDVSPIDISGLDIAQYDQLFLRTRLENGVPSPGPRFYSWEVTAVFDYQSSTLPDDILGVGPICLGDGTTLTLDGGNLLAGHEWVWYEGSCNGTQVGTGDELTVSPIVNTTYYLRAEGASRCLPIVCEEATVVISPDNTIDLTSAVGTDDQTICFGDDLIPVTYSTSGATGANFSGLPDGVTGEWDAGTITISGTPTELVGSPYTYQVNLTGGCGTVGATGTISIDPQPSISIAPGGEIASICENESYTVSGVTIDHATAIVWTHDGQGTLADENTLTPTYESVAADLGNTVTLTLEVTGLGGCGTTFINETVEISVAALPFLEVTGDAFTTICEGEAHTINNVTTQNGTLLWTHDGEGVLTNETTSSPTYQSVQADAGNEVTLSMVLTSLGDCSQVVEEEYEFVITVETQPVLTAMDDEEVCDTYEFLPILGDNLINPSYYLEPVGAGTSFEAGDVITVTDLAQLPATVYVYDESPAGACTAEISFELALAETPSYSVSHTDPSGCNVADGTIQITGLEANESYTVAGVLAGPEVVEADVNGAIIFEALPAGNYVVTVSKEDWCLGTAFNVTINNPGAPLINDFSPVGACDVYAVPEITGVNLTGNEAFYSLPGGPEGDGVVVDLTEIISDTIIYAYDVNGACYDEKVLMVEIYTTPQINPLDDVDACGAYRLPSITGNITGDALYYTEPGGPHGGGQVFAPGYTFTIDNIPSNPLTLYIYEETGTEPNCFDEQSFTITLYEQPELLPVDDVASCDWFVLEELLGENLYNPMYYTELFGAGDAYTTGDTLFFETFDSFPVTLYAFDQAVGIQGCVSQVNFEVTLHKSPQLAVISDVVACDSFVLEDILSSYSVETGYYSETGASGQAFLPGDVFHYDASIVYPISIYAYASSETDPNCSDELSFTITLHRSPELELLTESAVYCDYDEVEDITVLVNGTPDYTVYFSLNGENQSVSSSESTLSLGNDDGTYVVTAVSDAQCTSLVSYEVEITIISSPSTPVLTTGMDELEFCYNDGESTMLTVEGEGDFTWFLNDSEEVFATGNTVTPIDEIGTYTYWVIASTPEGCRGEALAINVSVVACDIVIPEAFTPNGDGFNDYFVIENIEAFPGSKVTIFNRWGAEIYSSDAYANDWNGQSHSRLNVGGDIVPEGTYYYLIELGGVKDRVYKGWVYVKP